MLKIKNARWATPDEKNAFYQYVRSKNTNKDIATYDWLSINGAEFLRLHESYIEDKSKDKAEKILDSYEKSKQQYNEKLREFTQLKNNGGRCECKGNLVYIDGGSYQMIGCDNWREQGYNHTKIYSPRFPELSNYCDQIISGEILYEPSTNYLQDLRVFYKLPKYLKPSLLLEYLLINGVKPLVNIDAALSNARESSRTSKQRESIIKPVLHKLFDSVYHQKMIVVSFSDGSSRKIIPDFITIKNNSVYILEQKKSIDLISIEQIELYCKAVSIIMRNAKKDYELSYYFIVEQGESNLEERIINFKDLVNYEFN
jgi:hypothetical protein